MAAPEVLYQTGTHGARPSATSGVVLYFCTTDNAVERAATGAWTTLHSFSSGTGQTGAFEVVIDGGGSAITTGVKLDFEVPFGCTLTAWRLLADTSGSIVIDVWKDTYANFPPTVADTISTSKPTLSAATKAEDTTITDWTEVLAAGDILRFNVDSAATVTRVLLSLSYTRS
jgi:hypothetical protein